MSTTQIQLKVSLSDQLANLLHVQADKLGIPVTQFVKHLIIKAVETETYPVYPASDWLEKKTATAVKNSHKAITVSNVGEFLANL